MPVMAVSARNRLTFKKRAGTENYHQARKTTMPYQVEKHEMRSPHHIVLM